MWKRLRSYSAYVDTLLTSPEAVDQALLLEEHRDQIGFFQHERLIHLLVTLAFALFTLLSFITALVLSLPSLFLLTGLLLLLLVPYLVHYYHLENGVQRLYIQYDQIQKLRAGGERTGWPE